MAGTIIALSAEAKDYLELYLVPIPDQYKTILQENISLVKELFPLPILLSKDNEKKLGVELLHFLEMVKEIFAHSTGFTSCDRIAMTKFREVYRKRFRGFSYLSLGKLRGVHLEASETAINTLANKKLDGQAQATPVKELNALISQEQTWIGRVNTFKRDQIVFSIKADAFEAFRERIHEEFPFNPDNEMQFYDDSGMERKFQKLMGSAVQRFIDEIPLEKDKAVLNGFGKEFENLLISKVRNHLIQTNTENRAKAEAFMNTVIDDLTKMYRSSFSVIQKSPLMKVQEINELHRKSSAECVKKFWDTKMPGNSLFHEQYENKLNEQIYGIFKDILEKAQAAAKVRIHSIQNKSKAEVEACIGKITDIFGKHCAVEHVAQIKKIFDEGLGSTIENLQGTTIADADKLNILLENADPAKKIIYPIKKVNLVKTQDVASNSSLAARNFRETGNIRLVRSALGRPLHQADNGNYPPHVGIPQISQNYQENSDDYDDFCDDDDEFFDW